jgi:chromosome partitioning protein
VRYCQKYPHMKFINIYNGKGGTCKTTLTLGLSWFLSSLGFSVVLIDCDGQGNASTILPYPYREPTLVQVIAKGIPLHQAMYQARKNLYVVPAAPNISEAVNHINTAKDWFVMRNRLTELANHVDCSPRVSPLEGISEIRLKDIPTLERPAQSTFRSIPGHVDFVIADHVPNPDDLTESSLYASGEIPGGIIIPVELEKFAIDGIPRTLLTLNTKFSQWQKKLNIIGITPINMDHRKRTTSPFLGNLVKTCGQYLTKEVHTDANVSTAQAYGETILEYERAQGISPTRAAKEFFEIALQIAGYQGTSPDFVLCKACGKIHTDAQSPFQTT